MPDRGHTPENGLEKRLEEAGQNLEYPPTPDLAQEVRRRIEAEHPGTAPGRRRFSPRWAAVAAALLLVAALPILFPQTRSTVGDLLTGGQGAGAAGGAAPEVGKQNSSGERGVPSTPAESRASSEDRAVGRELSLKEARERLPGGLLLPGGLGRPDGVYAAGASAENGVMLFYDADADLPPIGGGIGAVLTEIPGTARSAYPQEISDEGSEAVSVYNERAYWVPARSSEHPDGRPDGRGASPDANALLWEQQGTALRLETNLPKREAIRLAESVG